MRTRCKVDLNSNGWGWAQSTGEELASMIRLHWHQLKVVGTSKDSSLDDLFDKFSETYTEKLGPIKSFSAKLFLKENDKPYF